ncbi:hypothetical protein D1872_244910 [compost metagenome]
MATARINTSTSGIAVQIISSLKLPSTCFGTSFCPGLRRYLIHTYAAIANTITMTATMIVTESLIKPNCPSATVPCGLSTDKSSRPHADNKSGSPANRGTSRFPAFHGFIIDLPHFSVFFPVMYRHPAHSKLPVLSRKLHFCQLQQSPIKYMIEPLFCQ